MWAGGSSARTGLEQAVKSNNTPSCENPFVLIILRLIRRLILIQPVSSNEQLVKAYQENKHAPESVRPASQQVCPTSCIPFCRAHTWCSNKPCIFKIVIQPPSIIAFSFIQQPVQVVWVLLLTAAGKAMADNVSMMAEILFAGGVFLHNDTIA